MNPRLIKYVHCIKKGDIRVGGVSMMLVDPPFFSHASLKHRRMLKLCVEKSHKRLQIFLSKSTEINGFV